MNEYERMNVCIINNKKMLCFNLCLEFVSLGAEIAYRLQNQV